MRARLLVAVLSMAAAVPAAAQEPLGVRPTFTDRALSVAPNAQAIVARIWVPGLDDGYVPQGLTVAGNAVYVGAYKPVERQQDRGPCRLYRINPADGSVTGTMDLPPACGHAGGLARGPVGTLYVVDTRVVFEVKLGAADDPAIGRIAKATKLGGLVKGSFAAGGASALWVGAFEREAGAKLYQISHQRIGEKATVTEADASAQVVLPTHAQGGAFDAAGKLWISRSTGAFGELVRMNAVTGAVEARYEMPAGLEDLGFDAQGRLWTLSEAGSRRWNQWATFFPLVFAIDPAKLK